MSPAQAIVVCFFHGFHSSPSQALHDYHLRPPVGATLIVAQARRLPIDPMPPSPLPKGDYKGILVAFSGAGRQVAELLSDRRVKGVLLLDAVYRESDAAIFRRWMRQPGHVLVAIGNETSSRASRWLPGAVLVHVKDSHQQIPRRRLQQGLETVWERL